jgi:hypothetical protein
METLINLYSLFKMDKRKERFDIILEPLQALTQLSLMAFCPKGSKLTISNNLLFIQTPGWVQGVLRSYNHDKKDDLFFLFSAIIRFNKFYSHLKTSEKKDDRLLFDLLIKNSKRGIDNILQTYSNVDQPSLLHTLQLYRTLLDNPDLIINSTDNAGDNNSKKNIDEVFIKIRDLYSHSERSVICNILLLTEKRPEYYETYIQGLNNSMEPINNQIKKWINDNIVY